MYIDQGCCGWQGRWRERRHGHPCTAQDICCAEAQGQSRHVCCTPQCAGRDAGRGGAAGSGCRQFFGHSLSRLHAGPLRNKGSTWTFAASRPLQSKRALVFLSRPPFDFLQCVLAAAGGPCHCTAAFAVQSRPCPAAARPATQMQFSWPRSHELLRL